jgi:peptidoglycan/xylan/chitin deacetylase (PgdA/CDA1 family)
LVVFAISGIQDLFTRLFGVSRKATHVILYYHSIPESQRQRFCRQLDVIQRHAMPIAIGAGANLKSGVHYAGITFDDGFDNFAEVALPEMAKRSIPSTVFVIADALGKAFGPDGRPESVMSAERILQLPHDLVMIGSHTLTHSYLPSVSEHVAQKEIAGSRAKIEALLGRPVLFFSFPYGGFTSNLVEQCREAGYQRVFTTLPELVSGDLRAYAVGRVRVDPDDWPLEFRLKLAGAYRWLPWAFVIKRKLRTRSIGKLMFMHSPRSRESSFRTSIIQEVEPQSTL